MDGPAGADIDVVVVQPVVVAFIQQVLDIQLQADTGPDLIAGQRRDGREPGNPLQVAIGIPERAGRASGGCVQAATNGQRLRQSLV